jgi:RsiW-degrading membrane proteinase PrsW (M82 family)
MRCEHCANDVPDGAFCTRCGAHQQLAADARRAGRREHRYAAQPTEPVVTPSMFATLFPHLGYSKLHEFRWAFWAGLGGVVLLAAFGLLPAAILVAIFLVPVLYLIYLYEGQVYREQPARVVGFTVGGGVLLGIVVSVVQAQLIRPTAALNPTGGLLTFTAVAVMVPVFQELIKPLPALLLPGGKRFAETVDGLVFGVAAGLGFGLADSLIRYAALLSALPIRGDSSSWLFVLLTLAVFQPLLQGTTTGAIVAALWRHRGGSFGRRELFAVGFALAAHVVFSGGSVLLASAGVGPIFSIALQAVVLGGLVIYLRYMLHHALLEEASRAGLAETVCANCQRRVIAAGFCPHCGMALSASPTYVTRARRIREDISEEAV